MMRREDDCVTGRSLCFKKKTVPMPLEQHYGIGHDPAEHTDLI